jgi:hypothetical protein
MLFGTTAPEAPEFGDRLGNPRDLVKNRLAIELHNFENFCENVNQFNVISDGSPTIQTMINLSE